jgi:hypothetical protein
MKSLVYRELNLFLSLTMLVLGVFLTSCEQVELISDVGESGLDDDLTTGEGAGSTGWLIPVGEVMDGGPGKDGIPALNSPALIRNHQVDFLSGHDLVVGLVIDGEPRAYPHLILDWHEIINDQIGSSQFAITYCPLTGSGIGWNRALSSSATTFGVSGMLYNSNLIPYDRDTDSYWSQMKLQCVHGPRRGEAAITFPILETTWQTWREIYPDTKVVSTDTGYKRPYGVYPYGSYRTVNRLLFPVNPTDDRLPPKERVGGVIINDAAKVYRFSQFEDGIVVVNDTVNTEAVVIAGSEDKNLLVIFGRSMPDGSILTFTSVQDKLPVIMQDNEGTLWDVFGWGIAGPRVGQQLPLTRSYIAYWFAWGSFYPGAEIYPE